MSPPLSAHLSYKALKPRVGEDKAVISKVELRMKIEF